MNALKLIWIRKFKTSTHKWKNVAAAVYREILQFEQLGSAVPYVENQNKFWSNVFQAYDQLASKVNIEKPEEMLAEPIFCNRNIKIGNKVIFYKKWVKKMSVL